MDNAEMMNSLIEFWKKNQIFQRSIDERNSGLHFRFFDGPPFASGTPHFGHLLTSSLKDLISRFWTMKGYQVERKWGRDCHGLPVEKAVEKSLGIDGKRDIENKIGIEKFTKECRKYVSDTNDAWQWIIDHIGRRADIDNAYYTMHLPFMETVINCFDSIYKNNQVYRGFKVQWYCPSCATPHANNDVAEGYQDKTDTTVTVKFKMKQEKKEENSDSLQGYIQDEEGKYLLQFFEKEHQFSVYPFAGTQEENTKIINDLGLEVVTCERQKVLNRAYYHFTVKGELTKEQTRFKRTKVENSDNTLGIQFLMDGTIVSDPEEMQKIFKDFTHLVLRNTGKIDQSFTTFFLAWTTTPWTLPSNMFLAVGPKISYSLIYDFDSKEYYLLGSELLKKYYKNSESYRVISEQLGSELEGLTFEPLFPYVSNAPIADEYKEKFFQVVCADYVTTADGTGIVHIAPTFGADDFDAVTKILPADKALERMFMPVNEYGEYNELVNDYEGQSVLTINDTIIERLKSEGKLVKKESITHSYPHCWRCGTPLISKAMSSRFIKEKEMNAQTLEDAKKINFVPESVSNRFVNGLQQAPDWNITRNRYRGSPLPIWQNIDDENDHFTMGSLEEIYQFSRSGSKNLTKFMLIRHGRTNFNLEKRQDCRGDLALLNDLGKEQAEQVKEQLKAVKSEPEKVIILSPMERTRETAFPTLKDRYTEEEIKEIRQHYEEFQAKWREIRDKGESIAYLHNEANETLFDLSHGVYGDFLASEFQQNSKHNQISPCELHLTVLTSQPLVEGDECVDQVFERVQRCIRNLAEKFRTQTIIIFSHGDPILGMRSAFSPFDYLKEKNKYYPKNGKILTYYYDHDKQAEIDLHKPYVDSYWGIKDGKTYKRIPEVMDCWFESGAMPFGQSHYLKGQEHENGTFTADFIAEGLDQTRGRFRSLHVVGHAIEGNNAAKNIIVNGLVLAEDGKKMSKKLKNYPDPQYLLEKRGGDAFRMYVLSSPAVRAEPLRFSEKGVEQTFKDFNLPLQNVYNFFETYAKIDHWKDTGMKVFFADAQLTKEQIVRINPDIVLYEKEEKKNQISPLLEACNIQVSAFDLISEEDEQQYFELLKKYHGKRILLLGEHFSTIWKQVYETTNTQIQQGEVVELPTYKIENDLDKWILAELNNTITQVDEKLSQYLIDEATKISMEFIDKLTNRYLRRSRRRFRAEGMTADKNAAYATLFHVLRTYLQVLAPFAPFLTEYLWKNLEQFEETPNEETSIHLSLFPFASEKYLNKTLMEEIAMVRKIIKLSLFIRAKNKIAVKQPLKKLEVTLE